MSSTKRITVTFGHETMQHLKEMAHQKKQSAAQVVRELVDQALELKEDYYLSQLAQKSDVSSARTYSHDKAWK